MSEYFAKHENREEKQERKRNERFIGEERGAEGGAGAEEARAHSARDSHGALRF